MACDSLFFLYFFCKLRLYVKLCFSFFKMTTCSEGRLVRRKAKRAWLVVLTADAAAAELAVNLSAVRWRRLNLAWRLEPACQIGTASCGLT